MFQKGDYVLGPFLTLGIIAYMKNGLWYVRDLFYQKTYAYDECDLFPISKNEAFEYLHEINLLKINGKNFTDKTASKLVKQVMNDINGIQNWIDSTWMKERKYLCVKDDN